MAFNPPRWSRIPWPIIPPCNARRSSSPSACPARIWWTFVVTAEQVSWSIIVETCDPHVPQLFRRFGLWSSHLLQLITSDRSPLLCIPFFKYGLPSRRWLAWWISSCTTMKWDSSWKLEPPVVLNRLWLSAWRIILICPVPADERLYFFVKNSLCTSIVHPERNGEFDWRRERWCDICESVRSIWLHHLLNEKQRGERKRDDHLRQSPQTRRFFVIWIRVAFGFTTKFHAMASFSLWPQSTDATVSFSSIVRVIQLESYWCPCAINSFDIRASSS
jgi:hypothetical protein